MIEFCVVCGAPPKRDCYFKHSAAIAFRESDLSVHSHTVTVNVDAAAIRQGERYLITPVCLAIQRHLREPYIAVAGEDYILIRGGRAGELLQKIPTPDEVRKALVYYHLFQRDIRPIRFSLNLPKVYCI